MDEEIKKYYFQKNSDLVNLPSCEDSCHCGLYYDLSSNERFKAEYLKKAQLIKKENKLSCANASSYWICKDPLFLQLKFQSLSEPISIGL